MTDRMNLIKELDSLYGYETIVLDGENVKVIDMQEMIEFKSCITERLEFYVEQYINKLDMHCNETVATILQQLINEK